MAAVDRAPEQIAVESEHLPLVMSELGGGQARVVEENNALGLTLVELVDPGQMLTTLTSRMTQVVADDQVLDEILRSLRSIFTERYAGWIPTMGKNRTLTGVQFKPYSNGGGFTRPEPTGPRELSPPTDRDGVNVGLLDARLIEHRALKDRYLAAHDALAGAADPEHPRLWWEGHATFIAGLILDGAPDAQLEVRTALRRPGPDDDWTMPLWEFAERLEEFRRSGVRVLNLSLGVAPTPDDGRPPIVLERAIARLSTDMVVVAAAGNHGTGELSAQVREREGLPARNVPLYPAALDGVLAVGALHGEELAEFNPRGVGEDVAPWIDVFAPGVDLVSTYAGDGEHEGIIVPGERGAQPEIEQFSGWASWSGTSFAAAVVTGQIAALLDAGANAEKAVATVRQKYARGDRGLAKP